jgi:hypothetical protein
MKYRGNPINRTKFFLIDDDHNDSLGRPALYPKYSYPGFQWENFKNYKTFSTMPIINNLVQNFRKNITYTHSQSPENIPVIINHIIGTQYCGADDYIGYHDDKTKDITKDSYIYLLSFGDRRELHLRPNGSENPTITLVMEPGSLFILGPKTNATMQHSIVKTHEEKILRRREEDTGVRISLVLRNVSTIKTREEVIKKIKQARVQREKSQSKKLSKSEEKKKVKLPKDKDENAAKKNIKKRKRVIEDMDSDNEDEKEDTMIIWRTTPAIIKKGKGKIHQKECAGVKQCKLAWSDFTPVEDIQNYQKCAFCNH